MITKIKLKNWRTHLDSEIKFSEGTNCFIGPMGSGKTSVMDALCFGLFGTFLNLQQRKIKLEDIVMKKPVPKDRAEVTIFFDMNGFEYNVKRIVNNGRSTAEIRKNGELIEGPQATKVTKEVERILKMDYDLFTRAIYSEQNQLDMFLTIPKGQRMKKIDELLAIDKFEKARSNTKSLINKFSDTLNEKKKMIESMKSDESFRNVENIKREFSELNERGARLRQRLAEVVRSKESIEKELSKLKEQQKQVQRIDEDTKKFKALLEITEKDVDKLKEELVEFAEATPEQMRKDYDDVTEEIKKYFFQIQSEKKSFDDLKEEYADDNANIRIIESEKLPKLEKDVEESKKISEELKAKPLKKLQAQLEKEKALLEKKQLSLQKASVKISELEESMRELENVGNVCPICDGKLTDAKKEKLQAKRTENIDAMKKEIKTLQPEIVKIRRTIETLENDIGRVSVMEKQFENIKDSEKKLKELQDLLEKSKAKTVVFEKQKKMFEKNLEMLEAKHKELQDRQNKITQVISKEEEVSEKITRMKDYENKLFALRNEKESYVSFTPSILEKREQEYMAALGMKAEVETNIKNLAEISEDKRRLLQEIESKKDMIEKSRKEIEKMDTTSMQLEKLVNALALTQEQLRKDFVESVNKAMETIWSELYPYKDIYNIRLGIEDRDYVLQMQDSTGWVPADGIASGGERSMACLALRIAFSLVLAPQLKWLVLDEPTHNLDAKAVEELSNVLRERIATFVDQVFLITHDPALENAVSGFLYRLDREKEKDGHTKVNLVSSPSEI
ncbi:MAG: SMC family ATPase [Candidatus Aenigmarchaeota archaeon]|nr:SMC family ATPase [Candidatus Aenigmarchaeota archaeon]